MGSSLNRATLIGHLGRDPEVRSTQDGRKIVTLNVATSESWKDKNTGERKERSEWHKVVIFNDALAGVAEKYLFKGSKLLVEGQLQTRKWTDKDGADRYSTEIVLQAFGGQLILLDSKRDGGTGDDEAPPARRAASPVPELDDLIPY